MRIQKLKAAVLLALSWPMQAMAAETGFEQLIAELDSMRAHHDVAGFALTVVTGREGVRIPDRDFGRPDLGLSALNDPGHGPQLSMTRA